MRELEEVREGLTWDKPRCTDAVSEM